MFTALLHCIFCTIKKLQFLLRYLSGVFSLFLPGSGYETYNSVSGSRKKFRIQPNPDSQWENETSSNFFFFEVREPFSTPHCLSSISAHFCAEHILLLTLLQEESRPGSIRPCSPRPPLSWCRPARRSRRCRPSRPYYTGSHRPS